MPESSRSIRVELSANATGFIQGTQKAADSLKGLAREALGVRTAMGHITPEVDKLQRAVRGLSVPAGVVRDIRGLGTALGDITPHVNRLNAALRGINVPASALRDIRALGTAFNGQLTHVNALITAMRGIGLPPGGLAGNDVMRRQIQDLEDQIRRMRAAAGAPIPVGPIRDPAGAGAAGAGARSGSVFGGSFAGNLASNAASAALSSITSGIKDTVKATADYETQLKTFGAVTKASNVQMKEAGELAIKLGGDASIAGASAGDAAEVLTELAKGGMSVASSFAAAKGTLQLASAATVDVGTAAGIQTAALNMFSLGAGNATKVANILSNTAAASAGEITDYAEGMKYTGVQAHALGMTLTDTSAALGVLGQNGELGSIAGTNLNDMLLRLNPQTKKTKDAMHELGVSAFDAKGQFVGMPTVISQLAAAHERLSPAAFESATKIAFGVQGMRAAGIYAEKGAGAYTDMSKAIDTGAGAAAFSAAKMSGLGGAILNVKNQLETAQVTLGEKFSPALQTALGSLADFVPKLTGFLTGSSLGGGLSAVGKWFGPLVDGAKTLITTAWPYVQKFAQQLVEYYGKIVSAVKPVADAVGGLFKKISSDGTVKFFGDALNGLGTALSTVAGWLKPVGEAIGGVVKWFGNLPAPVKDAAIALGIMKFAAGPLVGIFKSVRQSIVMATYGMGALGFAGRSVGASLAIVGTSIKTAFGGWLGLGITAAVAALTFFAGASDKATSATADFSDAIDTNTGKLNDNANAAIASKVQDAEKAYVAAGGAVGDYTSAVKGLPDAQTRVIAKFTQMDEKAISGSQAWSRYGDTFKQLGITQRDVAVAYATGGDAVEALQTKVQDGARSLIAAGKAVQDPSAAFADFGDVTADTSGKLDTLRSYTQQLADQQATATAVAKNAAAATAAAGAAAVGGSGGVKDMATNTGDMNIALQAASISAGNAAPAYDGLGAAIDGAKLKASDFFTLVASKTVGDPATVITPMSTAFDAFNKSVSDADTTTQMFMMTMDKLAGRDVSVEDAMSANAAAARGVGAAQRQTVQNLLDQKKAVADLATAKANLNKQELVDTKNADGTTQTNKDGSHVQHYATASDATTPDDIAAAQLRLADANDKVAGSQDTVNQAYTEYQKSAALRIVQVAEQTNKTGGFGKAVTAATAEMQKQRDAFIAQQPAADRASGAADKLADKYGLIPKNVTTIISGDTKLAQAAAKYAQDTATKTAIRKYELKLTAESFPAVTKAKDLSKLADAATALRKLILNGEDNASPKVKALLQQIADLQKAAAKPITLSVNAAGGVVTIKSDGSFKSGTKEVAGGYATGGYVSGPGGPREDKIPAMLSNGEFVINAAATKKNLPLLHQINKYADGGLVGPANLTLGETGNIDPAIAHITGIINNARKSASALNAVAAVGSAVGMNAAKAAETQLGVPYVYAAESPGVAFDCSGLTKWAYEQVGVALAHYSGAQAVGQQVTQATLQPGDLSVWDGHVNMYVGGGKIIEAPEPGKNVRERPVYTENQGDPFLGFWRPAVLSKNYVPSTASPAQTAKDTPTATPTGSGVERWRSLALQVAKIKGQDPASVNVMLNQMARESSGNPQAINLSDSNARKGTPSEGLLQFIQPTFDAYADPGFTNIWDPQSQMRAWYDYVQDKYGGWSSYSHRNGDPYGAYANGGLVSGPGSGRSDSIPARVSNGEYIVNAKSTAANLPLLSAINKYADGGLVGSLTALSGRTASTVGPELSQVVSALQDIAQAVRDARDAVSGKRDTEQTKWDALMTARTTAAANIAAAEGRLKAAQKAGAGSLSAQQAAASAQLQARSASSAASVAAAQQRLAAAQAAPHTGQWGKAIAAAEAALKKAQGSSASAQAALDARISAVTKSKASSAAAKIELAQLQLTKVQSLAKLSVGNAQRSYDAAHKTTQAYAAAANAAEAYQRAQQRVFRQQQARAAEMDRLSTSLSDQQQRLAGLRSSRGDMMSSLSSTVSGFDGGITGHNDTRTSFAAILKGQQYNAKQALDFNHNIEKLSKLGLSNDQLNSIASAGVDGGGVTAAALAKATPAQIKQLNSVATQMHHIGDNVGNVVAGQFYDAGIAAGTGLVKGLQSQIGAIQKVMNAVASTVVTALTTKLQIHSPSRVMHGHGVNIVDGLNNGILSGYGKVGSSMAGLVQVPNIPSQNFGRQGSSAPQVSISIGGSDALSQAVLSMIDVEINGFAVDVVHSANKAAPGMAG